MTDIKRKVKIRSHWEWAGLFPKYIPEHYREINLRFRKLDGQIFHKRKSQIKNIVCHYCGKTFSEADGHKCKEEKT